jgi:zinc protease
MLLFLPVKCNFEVFIVTKLNTSKNHIVMKGSGIFAKVTWLILLVCLIQVQKVNAQALPVDPAIRIGKLENGLTYYLRKNQEPKERASFYIIQNVGAMLENDDQDGLAHFLEHMAFNGTKNFPDKGVINTLERYGVAFGRNINAYTSQNETVYNLSDVPVNIPGLIDTCLLILHDWSDFLLLSEEEIDLERGVIAEEWRTRRNAGFRMQKQIMPVLYHDSKYAKRDVIGSLDVIHNFDYETLRKFYHDWYRTDLQAIAVVGDIDVDEVEQKIVALFSKIEAVDNAPERVFHEIPFHSETLYAQATDPEATSHSISIYMKHEGTPPEMKSVNYYRNNYINSLFNRMMNERINELVQKGEPPFIAGGVSYGGFARGYNILSVSANAHPNRMDEGLRAIYTEAQRVNRHGFTASELERAKSNILTQTETRWKQQDKIRNDQFIRQMVSHYLTGEPLVSMDFEWQFVQAVLPSITVEEVSSKAGEWMRDENRVIVVSGPDAADVKLLSEEEVLSILKEVENSTIEPYKEEALAESLVDKELKGSPVVKTRKLDDMKAVEWTLANNAKVVYRYADYQKDNVMLQALSPGGNSLYSTDKLASALMLGNFIGSFGVGDFDATALRRMLAGKNVSLSPGLSGIYETFSGSASPRDFEILLQLLYLYFEEPRFDEEAYQAMLTRLEASVANMQNNPQKIMSDSLQRIFSNYSDRTKLITPELFKEFSLQQMEEIYRDRFMDAGDFTFFIVGNIEEETAKTLAEKYIGSLTDHPRTENWKDNNVGFPKGRTEKQIPISLQTEKANVVVAFNNTSDFIPGNNLAMDVLREVLRLRYIEEIREKEGGTYGVSVGSQNERHPRQEKRLQMSFDTDPEKAEHLKSILYREIDLIVKNGPTEEDLDKVVKNMLKEIEQAKPNNGYWMNVLTRYYQVGINNSDPDNYENILTTFTVEDIHRFAKNYFNGSHTVDVVFVPLK